MFYFMVLKFVRYVFELGGVLLLGFMVGMCLL